MEAWTGREPTRLPDPQGPRAPLRLFDTAAGRVRATQPGPTARMYVCGITPYDATHLGHAATYVAFDLVHRAWLDLGHAVHYVQNVTDVDDPLLERAVATGRDWRELARAETALFAEDMAALDVLPPQDYIGAVESIPSVVGWVRRLEAAGAVYQVDEDRYFDAAGAPGFGSVANLPEAAMRAIFAERGGDPDRPGKRHPLDPLLWQAERPDEPAWDTELGHGRPGWHIECTAIALDHLGMAFDVQGGGSDLAFPHHEMCAAQARVATGRAPFAQHFVHTGMVGYDGHKMSKSRGNLVFVSALRRDGVPPAAIRLALLAHHYRSDWEWTDADLAGATSRLERWRAALALPEGPAAAPVLESVRAALADDLDAPAALAAVDAWVAAALASPGSPTSALDRGAPGEVATALATLLGVHCS
ncbi:MAG: cysteine--1-D-myo-inosityl 2-amino-2-deoxy-alpha-D-glucopyranoside ligase [Candidatus Nanopelagicales bacterium]|nr:cysteine--1-D-myo-inosityl 2-amino-2-deoxy-alpha-D-glucopyranoside ligase [Candidatus Nanopelagicales bacterium]